MEKLIEDYKIKIQNIEGFLNEWKGSNKNSTIVLIRERANCYRTFISKLEKLSK